MGNPIILGEGVFAINGVDVGLCRGGGQFVVEREYREVPADGDYGPVKGRIRKSRSVARLTMNLLEVIVDNLAKYWPATKVTQAAGPPAVDTFEAKAQIEDTDYADTVTWTGKTDTGRSVVVTIENAINLGNLDWTMTDKEEVVSQIVMTAAYDPADRTREPWKVEFTDAV